MMANVRCKLMYDASASTRLRYMTKRARRSRACKERMLEITPSRSSTEQGARTHFAREAMVRAVRGFGRPSPRRADELNTEPLRPLFDRPDLPLPGRPLPGRAPELRGRPFIDPPAPSAVSGATPSPPPCSTATAMSSTSAEAELNPVAAVTADVAAVAAAASCSTPFPAFASPAAVSHSNASASAFNPPKRESTLR